MKNFKPNQKVVFKQQGSSNPFAIIPKENEVVTIKSKCSVFPNSWDLYEYPVNKKGYAISYNERHLFPLEEVFSEQSQEDIERIESEIKKEQLIPVTQ